jgi:hypothetical protein
VTEVPEHLLQRSRERRAALGLGGDEGAPAEPSQEVARTEAAAPAEGVAAPAEAPPALPEPEPEPEPAIPTPRARVPVWAMPVLVLLPFWAIIYSGAFGEREAAGPPPPDEVLFQTNCASCHGAGGGGGSGPSLGGVVETFPAFTDHVAWVTDGSAPLKGQPYGATGARVATGAMPAFGASLTEEEIILVVCHERITFGGEEPPQECAENGADDSEGGETAGG